MDKYYEKLKKEYEREQRIIDEALWYLDNKSSVRDVAANFMVGKSTVWEDFTKRLKHIDMELYDRVQYLLHYNRVHSVEKMQRANKLKRR